MSPVEVERAYTDPLEERRRTLDLIEGGLSVLHPDPSRRAAARIAAIVFVDEATNLRLLATTERLLRALLTEWGEPLPKASNLSTLGQKGASVARRRLGRTDAARRIGALLADLASAVAWRNDYAHGGNERGPLDPASLKRDLARFVRALL